MAVAGNQSAAGPLMLDLQGLELTADEAQLLKRGPVGGVILFTRNYHGPEQLAALTAAIRDTRPELLIAVDHEGGRVQRFRQGFTAIPAMAALGRLCRHQPPQAIRLARDCGWLMASELIAHGIDISFAPVLDFDRQLSRVIGDRAFGSRAETVIALAGALMDGMHEAGMATTAKHFPGHGGVAADSHLEIPRDGRSYQQIEAEDLRPFARFAARQMDAVMPAHVIFSRCDPLPAGFSRFWLQQILRQRLGFKGMIFSDDLSMEGAGVAGGYPERAQMALQAGCDMVLVCNQPEAAEEVLNWLQQQGLTQAPKVASMKARRRVDLSELQADPRWQHTRQALQVLAD